MQKEKQRVREFYDEVGWIQDAEGLFQNARYEDLRPVSRKYIHRCHLRINRYIAPTGVFFLDAGSGPVQWPEYLTYSAGYRYRVCADISITALRAAREKLREQGLYVVADIACLPFAGDAFDAVVSMHAIHHLPPEEHRRAYLELHRVLHPGNTAAIVNGWYRPLLMRVADVLIAVGRFFAGRARKSKKSWSDAELQEGTYVHKVTPDSLRAELDSKFSYEIFPWRSLSPRFMQWFIRPNLGGEMILKAIFLLEDSFPHFFGRHGQYPVIVMRKADSGLHTQSHGSSDSLRAGRFGESERHT